MDTDLRRLIREQYPFPIAHAHKKTLAFLADDAQKLKCLIQAAESVIQFLALVVLAQLRHDLEHHQAPPLGARGAQLGDELRQPSFGKWQGILRDILKLYREHRDRLVLPELFDFYFKPGRGKKLPVQPVIGQSIDPLIRLRNQFYHPGIPPTQIPESITRATRWLEQLLAGLDFLGASQLAFIQRIEFQRQARDASLYRHELVQMNGCFSTFDRQHWDSEAGLAAGQIVVLASEAQRRSLLLDPFLIVADPLPVPGIFDV